jgi:hypothetical protein
MERTLSTTTDSAGRYRICGLPDGVRITARVVATDRRSAPVDVALAGGEVSMLDMVVGRPAVVAAREPVSQPTVVVASGPLNQTMQEFERRRRRGNGAYLTRGQIERMHAPRLTDLLRSMPGVSVDMSDAGGLIVELRRVKSFTMTPAPMPAARQDSSGKASSSNGGVIGQASVKKCPAGFLVDGLPIDGAGSADIDVRPEMIEAIEVYSGGMVPIEYAAHNAECGVVMIWTQLFANRSG